MPLLSQMRLTAILNELQRRSRINEGKVGSGKREKNPSPSGYTNMEEGFGRVADIGLDILGMTPAGPLASGIQSGTKFSNAEILDEELTSIGFEEGLSFGQKLGAALGMNAYGTGGSRARRAGRKSAAEDAIAGRQGYKSKSPSFSRGALGAGKRRARDFDKIMGGLSDRGRDAVNDPQGHGGGGQLGSDRDKGFGGPR